MTRDYCKFGIGRIPQVSNARILWTLEVAQIYSWHLMAWPSSCLTLLVTHGITRLPSLILSTSTTKSIFTAIPHLRTHPMGNSSHVGPTKTPTSECETHKLAKFLDEWNCPLTCSDWPFIPLERLIALWFKMWYISLMPIPAIFMLRFWVKQKDNGVYAR